MSRDPRKDRARKRRLRRREQARRRRWERQMLADIAAYEEDLRRTEADALADTRPPLGPVSDWYFANDEAPF